MFIIVRCVKYFLVQCDGHQVLSINKFFKLLSQFYLLFEMSQQLLLYFLLLIMSKERGWNLNLALRFHIVSRYPSPHLHFQASSI